MIRVLLIWVLVTVAPVTLASAQSRDVYTVSGIPVDEQAATVIEARQAAFAGAKLVGARMLINRITLPEDRAAAGGIDITLEMAELLAAAVDVEEEVAGAGRYRGKLAVVFNPANVRAFLEQNEVFYNDQPAPLAVVIPVARSDQDFAWSAAWPDRSAGHLAPTVTSRASGYDMSVQWEDVNVEVALNGAKRAVLAEIVGYPGAYRVNVASVTPAGVEELGTTARVGTMKEAVNATGELLDTAWKRSTVIRDETRTLVEATVRYTSLAEWNTLRGALARSPLVSEFQTRAVSRDGAVVAFVFAGDGQRLLSDLGNRGVAINLEPIGWVMSSAVSSVR